MMDLPLEGDITVPGAPPENDDQLSTLDEPIRETIVCILSRLHIISSICQTHNCVVLNFINCVVLQGVIMYVY